MEKTFEELIEGGLSTIDDFDDVPVLMLKLLQKVREATIEECVEILTDPNIPKSRMATLKTDRIKLT